MMPSPPVNAKGERQILLPQRGYLFLRTLQRILKTLNLLEFLNLRGFSWKRVTRFERATFTLAR